MKQTAISDFQWEQPHNVRYQKNEVQGAEFRGTFPAYLEVYSNATMKAGRFFSEAENEHRENVVVLGENMARRFFPASSDASEKKCWWTAPTFS